MGPGFKMLLLIMVALSCLDMVIMVNGRTDKYGKEVKEIKECAVCAHCTGQKAVYKKCEEELKNFNKTTIDDSIIYTENYLSKIENKSYVSYCIWKEVKFSNEESTPKDLQGRHQITRGCAFAKDVNSIPANECKEKSVSSKTSVTICTCSNHEKCNGSGRLTFSYLLAVTCLGLLLERTRTLL